jgi:hypothetical protein
VAAWHQRALSGTYRYLILDGVSVCIRLVRKVRQTGTPSCLINGGIEGDRLHYIHLWFSRLRKLYASGVIF